nr:MAG TPA: hypothetical protein [Inoviridae sp.]
MHKHKKIFFIPYRDNIKISQTGIKSKQINPDS